MAKPLLNIFAQPKAFPGRNHSTTLNFIAPAFCLLYFFLELWAVSRHEMWLDEAQHILLARDSHSLYELFYNARYEGHPLLWNIILYGLTRVSDSLFLIQLVHILISTSCVFVILRHSPFSLSINLLISFGYFLLYEYSVLSRNYGLCLLLVLLILANFSSPGRNFVLIFLFLALLVNTHLFGAIIACGFVIVLLKELRKQKAFVQITSLSILLCGICFFFLHIVPPGDHFMHAYNDAPFFSWQRLNKVMQSGVIGLLPLPDLSAPNYWSNHPFLKHSWFTLLSLVLFLLPMITFRKHAASFFFFYFCCACMLIFIYFSPLRVGTRHCGFISTSLFVACWLKKTSVQGIIYEGKVPFLKTKLEEFLVQFYFSALILLQFVSGTIFFFKDIQYDFSAAKKTAAFLDNTDPSDLIVLSHFTAGPPVKIYTDRKLFYLENNSFETFCKWNTKPVFLKDSLFLGRLDSLLKKDNEFIFVGSIENQINRLKLLNNRLRISVDFKLEPLATFSQSVIRSERYFIYRIKRR